MAENSGAEKVWTRVREIVRNRRTLWWTGGAVVLAALVGLAWLEPKRIHLPMLHTWITYPPDWFLPLGLGVAALVALAIVWKVPQWQVGSMKELDPKGRFDRVNEARKTLATILGGAAFLVGGFFTLQNLKVAQENLEVSREGQITERFTKAIEQLGAFDADGKKKIVVRLGGIYALEGIAKQSKELHWPIMEVLCSYVRENAPVPRNGENPFNQKQKREKTVQKNQAAALSAHPTADIQAILTVLGRRDRKYEREGQSLDLRASDLRGADLGKASLRGANLSGANLLGADLSEANLSRANLIAANLVANLRRADLSGADLGGADLFGANLDGANLQSAGLRETDLRLASLDGADLNHATLVEADLSGAFLGKADLRGANLSDTVGLAQEQIEAAIGDGATELPEDQNLHMPESWKK